jgi:hypothetical protein
MYVRLAFWILAMGNCFRPLVPATPVISRPESSCNTCNSTKRVPYLRSTPQFERWAIPAEQQSDGDKARSSTPGRNRNHSKEAPRVCVLDSSCVGSRSATPNIAADGG